MNITTYTLKFIALGKDKKCYLRYYVTDDRKGLTLNIACDLVLTSDQLQALNAGTLGGLVQKSCYQIRNKYVQIIETLNLRDNSYPTPDKIREYFNITEKALEIDWLIHKYNNELKVKQSTKSIYNYALGKFKQYFESNHTNTSVKALIQKETLDRYERWLYALSRSESKTISPITIHNTKGVIMKFLNYVAKEYNLPRIEATLHIPQQSSKWHISVEDVNRLLAHVPTTETQRCVKDIITLNMHIGMRISDILQLHKENISFAEDCAYIKFIEHKRKIERTVVVVDKNAIRVLCNYNGWNIQNHARFNETLKAIGKAVFKEELVKIYRVNSVTDDYKDVLKSKAISSHAFRRFAIEQNIIHYGIDVARSLSGHTNYQTITRHYAEFINKDDLKNILLRKI
jgi:integrase